MFYRGGLDGVVEGSAGEPGFARPACVWGGSPSRKGDIRIFEVPSGGEVCAGWEKVSCSKSQTDLDVSSRSERLAEKTLPGRPSPRRTRLDSEVAEAFDRLR